MTKVHKEYRNLCGLTKSDIKDILVRAVKELFEHQPDINDFTSETGQTEWNLAHHLANEISTFLPDYSCDLDVTKRNYDNRRPDIVFHRRGTNECNLLVVELKRYGSVTGIDQDIRKVMEDWFRGSLRYEFGAIINLKGISDSEIMVFQNENHIAE